MGWVEHLRKHIHEREEERLHLRCQKLETKADPTLTDIERKKALDNIAKDEERLGILIRSLIKAQTENNS